MVTLRYTWKLTTAAWVTAFISLVRSVIQIAIGLWFILSRGTLGRNADSSFEHGKVLGVFALIMGLCLLFVTLVLLFGLKKMQPKFFTPWIIISCFSVTVILMGIAAIALRNEYRNTNIYLMIALLMLIIVEIVMSAIVISHYRYMEIRQERDPAAFLRSSPIQYENVVDEELVQLKEPEADWMLF